MIIINVKIQLTYLHALTNNNTNPKFDQQLKTFLMRVSCSQVENKTENIFFHINLKLCEYELH